MTRFSFLDNYLHSQNGTAKCLNFPIGSTLSLEKVIKELNTSTFSIWGKGNFSDFIQECKEFSSIDYHFFKYHDSLNNINRAPSDIFKITENQNIIILTDPSDYYTIFPYLRRLNHTFIFPFSHTSLRDPKFTKHKRKTFVSLLPFAGTNMVLPVITEFFKDVESTYFIKETPVSSDPLFVERLDEIPDVKQKKDCLLSATIKFLNNRYTNSLPGEAFYNHFPIKLTNKEIPDFENSLKVLLIRDPRDMYISHYFRNKESLSDNLEDSLLEVMENGLFQKKEGYINYFPTLRELAELMCNAKDEYSIILKFEDLKQNPKPIYKKLLEEINISEDLSPSDVDSIINKHIFKGSFEYQTKDKKSRGDHSNTIVNGCRKGVSGDWKNHYTEKMKHTFKELAGNVLVDFGYEKNNQW